MEGWIWTLLALFVLIMLLSAHISKKSSEAFDPSVRVGAGWIAGPEWGSNNENNPVSVYARQIELAKQGIFNVV